MVPPAVKVGTVSRARCLACMSGAQIWIPYCGAGPTPAELALRWNLDPVLLAAMVTAVAGYVAWRRRGGQGRDLLAAAALVVAVIAFVSPLCALSSALFSARVTHHALLTAVIAPLAVFALPRLPRVRTPLVVAVVVQALAFWLWHSPPLYAWALGADAAYWLMQATLLAASVLFWSSARQAAAPAAALALLATLVQTGLLGALITFAARPLYEPHLLTTAAWGLTPLADQQLAGLIMWAPMAGFYLLAALAMVGRSLGPEPARRAPTW